MLSMLEIQKFYAIEREAQELTPNERKALRLDKALPIINDLGKWLHAQRQQVLPKSPIGKAIEYVTPLWESLQNYLHDGKLKIDKCSCSGDTVMQGLNYHRVAITGFLHITYNSAQYITH